MWLFATLWPVAHEAPVSTEILQQEYWRGLPRPAPGALPDRGIKAESLVLAGGFSTTPTTWDALKACTTV